MEEDRMLSDEILLGLIKANSGGGGGGGTDDYNDLKNQPKIEGVTLKGNKTAADLGLATAAALADKVDKVQGKGLSTNDFTDAYKTAIGNNTTALALKQNATDNNLDTEAKTIVGAINENAGDISSLKSGLTNLDDEVNGDATVYPYADVITIEDAVPSNLAECNVKIEPVQDLHGQSAPYVCGAGKNKLPLTLTGIKANNVYGTWNDNVYTLAGVTYTVYTDDGGNVTGIKVNGTYNGSGTYLSFWIPGGVTLPAGTYVYSSGMTATQANLRIRCNDGAFFSYTTNELTKTYEADTHIDIEIVLNQGDTVENAMLYPMIRLATETDATFAPYTNLCPISGHTEVDVQRDGGKNLFDKDDSDIAINKYLNHNTGELTNSSNNWDTSGYIYIHHLIGEDITFSGMNSVAQSDWEVCYYDKNKTFVSGVTGKAKTRTIPNDDRIAYLRFDYKHADTDVIQLEAGSSATPYEPFKGKTYTIALGDTIYGGTVDFDSGVMTVDRVMVALDSLNWEVREDHVIRSAISPAAEFVAQNVKVDAICSCYYVSDQYHSADYKPCIAFNTSTQVYLYDDTHTFTSTADAQQYLDGQTICYKLATPTTVQLTPQQIQLLKGTNTLTASTGQISVTVNGVSGSIGQVQEQVNELAEDVAEIKTLDYSTTEQKTGQKWIDGKDIYFRVNNTPISIIANDSWYNSGFTGIDTVIDYIVSMTRDSENIGSTFNNGHVDYVNRNNEVLIKGTNFTLTDNYVVVKQILYYTKTT